MKKLFNFFHLGKKNSAKAAKERLQIVVSHQRAANTNPEFIPELRKELLKVICKYIPIDMEQINVNLQKVGNNSILELNVTIPELKEKQVTPTKKTTPGKKESLAKSKRDILSSVTET
jgi:cell division topological specificity factor